MRKIVETKISEHYTGLQVSVHSAGLTDGGIQIRGVSIVDPHADGPHAEIAYLDELFMVCKTDIKTLLQGMPSISEVIARRPTIRATHRPDGTWSTSRLFPLPKFGDKPPLITIEAAILEIFDPLKSTPKSLTVRDAFFKVNSYRGSQPTTPGHSLLALTGYCSADSIRRVELSGTFDPASGGIALAGIVDGLDVTPELVRDIPYECPQGLNLLETLRGQVNGKFDVRFDPKGATPWTYDITGELNRGRLDDSRLPHPLTELKAGFHVTTGGFAIDNLTANSGPATLALAVRRDGFHEKAPMVIVAKATQLRLDRQLSAILPEKYQEAWQQSQPDGEVDLDATLRFDGTQWTPDVAVSCHKVAFTYPKFPYRLEHGAGQITLRNNALLVDMNAYSDIEEVHLRGDIRQPGPDWTGSFTVDTRNLRVDQKLTLALPPKPREIVESLNPRGSIGLFVHYRREPGQPIHSRISISLNGCDVRYDKFPYPLHNVRGIVEANDKIWTFQDLQGTNDTGLVRCQGDMKPGPEGDVLVLHFAAMNVPLEEELRDALRPSARQLWNELNPSGAVDLQVDVVHQTGWRDPQIRVAGTPARDSVSVEPRYFPYRLDKVRGEFGYENGRVILNRLAAEHGPNTRVTGRGFCEVDASGGWRLHLDHLDCGRLTTDRDLMQALPARLKKAITEMHVSGPMSMSGRFDLSSSGRPQEPLRAAWDLTADLHQVRMAYSLPLENINGKLWLGGEFDGHEFRSRGELILDSMTYKDFQFTEVRGPLWIDDQKLLLGGAVPAANGDRQRSITGHCCGGAVRTDGWVSFGPQSRYNFDAVVVQAQLARLAQEVLAGRQKLTGDLSGQINIRGQGSSFNLAEGNGHIELHNADVYELPAMVSLLKILSLRVPDTHAFSTSNIDFRLAGEHIYFERINFSGDAISLRGTGEMGLDKHLQLVFYTVVGRDQWRVPIVSDVLGGASQQLMAIYVDGPLEHPEVKKQALPAVNEALQELQAELQNMSSTTATTATAPPGTRPPPSQTPLPQRR
ncbi:MAG TPA: AsmA-like C-terminal region-containing protein [Pirellulales bacterium]